MSDEHLPRCKTCGKEFDPSYTPIIRITKCERCLREESPAQDKVETSRRPR